MKYIKYILTLLVILGIIWLAKNNPKTDDTVVNNTQEQKEICYSLNTKNGDKLNLYMNFVGQGGKDVSGYFDFIPAKKDSKRGAFVGIAGPLDQKTMSRTAKVWWQASAEGTKNTEELYVNFGDGSASVGFGEMKDRGDGTYIYANPDKLSYLPNLSQVDCDSIIVK